MYLWAACLASPSHRVLPLGADSVNPADPINRIRDQFAGHWELSRAMGTHKVWDLWALPDRETASLWTWVCLRGHLCFPTRGTRGFGRQYKKLGQYVMTYFFTTPWRIPCPRDLR